MLPDAAGCRPILCLSYSAESVLAPNGPYKRPHPSKPVLLEAIKALEAFKAYAQCVQYFVQSQGLAIQPFLSKLHYRASTLFHFWCLELDADANLEDGHD